MGFDVIPVITLIIWFFISASQIKKMRHIYNQSSNSKSSGIIATHDVSLCELEEELKDIKTIFSMCKYTTMSCILVTHLKKEFVKTGVLLFY